MSLARSTQSGRKSTDDDSLSKGAAKRLGGLLAGLDKLDPILSLPIYPETIAHGLAFAHFQLRSRLGAGRFGVVLLADDPSLGRQVVVKVPQPAVLADSSLRERFLREARATARLDHPGVVSVLEAGEVDELPYLAAAFIPGPTLREWRIQHPGPLPPNAVARFASAVATAVHHAHERGVLHCDLSPSNILLQPVAAEIDKLSAYTPLVTDFGLARLLDEDPALTRTLQIVGTPLYMAPEQARGDRRNLTARTDVYAIGVLLYELLVGDPPFSGGTSAVLTQLQVIPPDPPRRRVRDLPRDLNAICLKCLEKNPKDRYPSASNLADDLNRFLTGQTVAARPVRPALRVARWTTRNPITAALVAVAIAVTASAIGVATDRWAKEVQTRADLDVAAAQHAAATARAEVSEARAATAEFYTTLERIRRRRMTRVSGWTAANRADLSHISNHVVGADAVTLRTEIAAVAAAIDLGPPRAVAIGFHGYDVAFAPTGSTLAVGRHSTDAEGRGIVRLIDYETGDTVRELQFSPDLTWEERGGGRRDGCWSVLFSPDGGRLVAGTRSGWVMVWDLNRSEATPVTRWRHSPPTSGGPETARYERITRLAFDATGRLWSGDDQTAVAWDPTREWTEVERQAGYLGRPVSGKVPPQVLVRDRVCAAYPSSELYIRRESDQELVISLWNNHPVGRLSLPDDDRSDDNTVTDLVVSPDGTMVVASGEHSGHLKLWNFSSGRLLVERLLAPGSLLMAFRPDGQMLAVVEADRVQLFEVSRPAVMDFIGLGTYPLDDVDLTSNRRFLATIGTIPNRSGISAVEVHDLSQPLFNGVMFRTEQSVPKGNSRRRLAISPDGRELVTHSHDKYIRFSLNHSNSEGFGQPQATRDIRFNSQGKLWAVGGQSVALWPDGHSKVVSVGDSVTSLAAGDECTLVGLSNGLLARYSAAGNLLRSDPLATTAISSVAMEGDLVIAGTAAGDVLLVHSNRPPQTLSPAHADTVWAAAISPNGWFATGSADRDVRIWNQRGEPVVTLPQSRPVRRLFWSDEGRTLIILAEGERGIRRWHLERLQSEFAQFGLDSGLK